MKTRNLVLSVVVVIAVAAGGAAWWLFLSLDGLVKQAIQKWGPEITGVAVRVDSEKIEVTEGRGTIRGLYVGNPKGFSAPHALTLSEMRLTLDPASVTRDVVVIKELLLAAPDVVYERGQGSDNLSVIQKNVDAWVAKNAGAKKSDGPGRKFVIENVIIRNGKAHFGTAVSAPLPDLHLHDIGKKTNGASAGEAVKQVWGALLHSAGNLASRAGAAIKEGAAGVGDSVRKLFK
jgi:hypothetical protein